MAKRKKRESIIGSGVDEAAWRKLHPITPLAQSWAVFTALFGFLLYQNYDLYEDIANSGLVQHSSVLKIVMVVLGALLLIALIVGVYCYFSWRHMGYAVTENAVYYRNGILARNQRHARLSRIQTVNITHSLVGRLFGLGKIDIEVAGGADSNLSFGLLKTNELEAVRREILVRRAGTKTADASATRAEGTNQSTEGVTQSAEGVDAPAGVTNSAAAGPQAENGVAAGPQASIQADNAPQTSIQADNGAANGPQANNGVGNGPQANNGADAVEIDSWQEDGRPIIEVPWPRLLGSLFVNFGMIFVLVIGIAFLSSAVIFWAVFDSAVSELVGIVLGGVATIGVPLRSFAKNFNFRAFVTADGIRIRAGLTSTRAQTIAPARIHGLEIKQPFLWRIFGWYKVSIVQAGFQGSGEGGSEDRDVLLPVGSMSDMLRAVWMVYPDLGIDDPMELVRSGIEDRGPSPIYEVCPRRARIFDWITYDRNAIALTDRVVALRSGRITRKLAMFAYPRVQSVKLYTGPWRTKRRLRSLDFHLVSLTGSQSLAHVDEQVGRNVMALVAARARVARRVEEPEAWRKRVESARDIPAENLFTDGPEVVEKQMKLGQETQARHAS
ncbi:PH domain-containing protein [Gleimia hominis]|uniref:PH domain-containing protein n=1 Tax=Gleimia hominis TaxID=595468 RepID=A0ABU3ICD5_9ACTO|nr:PH domain-containing protein [Gleimia hominis]MDT3768040.1 PH domain-containing protein [Gleimia hominis]